VRLSCLNARNGGGDGGFARVIVGGLRLLFLLRRFTGFGAGNRRFDGGFTRVDRCFWFCFGVLRRFAGFGAGNRASTAALRGSTASAQPPRSAAQLCGLWRGQSPLQRRLYAGRSQYPPGRLRFFCLTRASRSLTRFTRGNRFAVIRFSPAGITTVWARAFSRERAPVRR
jgi:hypothetical protein